MRARLRGIRQSIDGAITRSVPHGTVQPARIALLLCSLLFLVLLAWSTWDHISRSLEREHALAIHLTAGAANELARQLLDLNSRLQAFTNQEQGLIAGISATSPTSPAFTGNLWSLTQLLFPHADGALVSDARGLRTAALGAWPGEQSERFLRQFLRNQVKSVHITDSGGIRRLNLAAISYRDGKPAGAFLIHMACNDLCPPIEITSPPGHSFHLAPAPSTPGSDQPPADGVHGGGAHWDGTLLTELPLGDTGWVVQDRLDPAYSAQLIGNRAFLGLMLGMLFLFVVLALSAWVSHQSLNADRERLDLRESRHKLQAILSAITDGIVLTDKAGRIELFNPAAEMMFGRLAEDLLDTKIERLIPELASSEGTKSLLGNENGARSPALVRETQARGEDGRDFPVRLWLTRVRFDGKPHLLTVMQDLTEQERNERRLLYLEQRDVLTGLLNRKEFEHRLSALMSGEQGQGPHVLCQVDVDQFTLLNDACGHEAGDELLKQLAILFNAKLEDAIVSARLGGDEFGALFPDHTIDAAREICNGFVQTVRSFLFTWRDQSFDVAVSIGLIEFFTINESPSSVLSKADLACHMAKVHGRDRIHTYHDGDEELTRHHGDMRLVSTISKALSDGRFHLFAQPIAPLHATGGGRRHFEILVRMVDESGNLVIPDQFIPAAERYILMPAVDRWIINRLFSLQADTLRAWHELEPDSFLFAVNLSGTSLADEGFLRYLKRQFADSGIPYACICFEVTETASIRNMDNARAFMNELGALGCSFALDDFGTGLSSYAYLRDLPVDYLKIDGSFVREMTQDPVNFALVESINQIGHVLGLETIAEWAENQVIINQLRGLNVDFAQGFGIGEPVPVCDLTLADATNPPVQEHRDHERPGGTHRARGGSSGTA